jgi:hypothetical protein
MARKLKKTKAKAKRPALRLREGMLLLRNDGTLKPRILQRISSGRWAVLDGRGGMQWPPTTAAVIRDLLRKKFYVLAKRRSGART